MIRNEIFPSGKGETPGGITHFLDKSLHSGEQVE